MCEIERGESGAMRWLQEQLHGAGFYVAIDGHYGPETAVALRHFQEGGGVLVRLHQKEPAGPSRSDRSEHLERAVVAMGGILTKLAQQVRPFGWASAFDQELRELEAALTRLRKP